MGRDKQTKIRSVPVPASQRGSLLDLAGVGGGGAVEYLRAFASWKGQRHGKVRREEKTDRHTTVRAEREARTNDMADTVVVVGRARARVVHSLSLELL